MFKKIILPGLLAGVIMLAVSMILSQIFAFIQPSLQTAYENPSLFRPWSDPIMSIFFLNPFILGLILSWIWDKAKILFVNEAQWKNGINFGLVYWLVSLPGMIISYSTFPLSLLMVLSWTVNGLVGSLCAGLLFSKMNGIHDDLHTTHRVRHVEVG